MIVGLDPAKKGQIDYRRSLASVDSWFAEQQAAGFTTSYGWRLGLAESDVTLLTGAFVLAKEAAAMGLGVPPLVDADGIPHELTIEELTAVMLGYGQHRAALSAEYATRKAAIPQPDGYGA
jgi:hypothetical protein